MLAINGRGVFLCYKHAAQQMIKQGRGGRIIGAASTGAKQGKQTPQHELSGYVFIFDHPAEPLFGAYSASKFAVRGLTQSAGKYHCGFLVNSI